VSLENEVDMVMSRLPGGAQVSAGSYWNCRTNAIYQNAADSTLPLMDFWHFIPTATAGNESLATCATKINTALNAVSPIAGNYSYSSSQLHAYTSADLPTSKGQGASDG
jgi:hypothetical protein